MCRIHHNNIGSLRNLSALFLLGVFLSILSGKTYCKRIVARADEPASFWVIVLLYFFLGSFILLGTHLCQDDVVIPAP